MQEQTTKSNLKFYERWMISILKTGQIPKHVAFIMDGNRRYAVKQKMQKTKGHEKGLSSLKYCLEWCLELGIEVVTVFAFAIENLNREKNEIETLFNLAKINLYEMAQKNQFLQKYSVKVNIIGDLNLLPDDVKNAMIEIMQLTKENKKLTLNICFCYNSTYEIENTVNKCINEIKTDITYDDFYSKLLINSEPDIIVRTSNEIRLSNFLTFQGNNSELVFLKENWPEINLISFLKIIVKFQLNEKNFSFNQLSKNIFSQIN